MTWLLTVASGLPSLKRKFFDRLEKVFAREKLASFVSATAIKEFEDKVVMHVVHNESITKENMRFCNTRKLCLVFRGLMANPYPLKSPAPCAEVFAENGMSCT